MPRFESLSSSVLSVDAAAAELTVRSTGPNLCGQRFLLSSHDRIQQMECSNVPRPATLSIEDRLCQASPHQAVARHARGSMQWTSIFLQAFGTSLQQRHSFTAPAAPRSWYSTYHRSSLATSMTCELCMNQCAFLLVGDEGVLYSDMCLLCARLLWPYITRCSRLACVLGVNSIDVLTFLQCTPMP